MTVREFCITKTQVGELCVLRECGCIKGVVYIDHEDLFSIDNRIQNVEVKSDEQGILTITSKHGDKVGVPCHYINF